MNTTRKKEISFVSDVTLHAETALKPRSDQIPVRSQGTRDQWTN